jgi:hypothetical protein
MVGIGKVVGCGFIVSMLSGCSSMGVIPKASETEATAAETPTATEWKNSIDGSPVVVAPEVVEAWEFLYRHITTTEFVLCLEGSKQEGYLVIDGFKLARMEASSINNVRYQPCASARYIGTAHNHPPVDDAGKSLCYQSEPDRRSFAMDQRAVVDVVLCGADRYRWWLKDGRNASKTIDLARVR